MKKISFISSLLLLIPFCAYSQSSAIDSFVKTKGLEHSLIGVSICDTKTGKELKQYNSNISMVPASTLKTVTTSTVCTLFAPDHRFQTKIYYVGSISGNGTLDGDIVIVGSGDPTLGSEYGSIPANTFNETILNALRERGVKNVSGSIVSDDRLIPYQGVSPAWTWEDMGNYYAAGVYGINYADNKYSVTFDTSKKGCKPIVKSIKPNIEGMTIDNNLLDYACSYDSSYIYGAPFSLKREVYGALPQKKDSYTIYGDIPDPALYAASQLKDFLLNNGIDVLGNCRTLRSDQTYKEKSERELLTIHNSIPLSEIVRIINVDSNNMFTEALLRLLSLKLADGSASKGIYELKKFWEKNNLNTEALFMYDGCGLSPENRVSPAFFTKMLFLMRDNKMFVNSLPVAGVDGTLAGFLKNTPLQGKARLKSGSIGGVICYVGYINTPDPKIVAVMVNNYNCSSYSLRRAMEKLLTSLSTEQ
ncbi:MAG: D-alanyl-D-alanine carboxypeptidase/D-alanyl-D-alanine-endopeptidase [Bacteroidales bacterium]|nr:D-alanyl-D-alanine carboxypeptidase/D-alanyl-D-alanine-endopeptidase [Bacteroidales bacterium]